MSAPKCHCGHDMHEHYMCGGPDSMRCYRHAECGCVQYVDADLRPREAWRSSAREPEAQVAERRARRDLIAEAYVEEVAIYVDSTDGLLEEGREFADRILASMAYPTLVAALVDALRAMNHMGDVMNGMDAVTDEDLAITEPAFRAVRAALVAATEQGR